MIRNTPKRHTNVLKKRTSITLTQKFKLYILFRECFFKNCRLKNLTKRTLLLKKRNMLCLSKIPFPKD